MIVQDRLRIPPETWTNDDVIELIDHANELAANGNPAGFFVSSGLLRVNRSFPFKPAEFDACRTWIEANQEMVKAAWQWCVRSDY